MVEEEDAAAQALLFVAQLACFQLDMASPVHRQAEQPEERTGNLVKSGDRPLHSVDKKIESALTCAHRPLRVGEAPKRRGQNTVFEATGELHPGFEAALRDPDCTIVPTVKVDGTCACIIGGRLYKRRDVRGGKRPPPGAVPGGRNCGGDLDLCWLVTEQSDPGDKYFLAAGAGAEGQFWCFSREGDRVVAKLDDGSYELIGKATSAHVFRLDDVFVAMQARMCKAILTKYLLKRTNVRSRGTSSCATASFRCQIRLT